MRWIYHRVFAFRYSRGGVVGRLTNKMVSDVAHSKSKTVSDVVPSAMLDTILLDDAASPHLWGFNRSALWRPQGLPILCEGLEDPL